MNRIPPSGWTVNVPCPSTCRLGTGSPVAGSITRTLDGFSEALGSPALSFASTGTVTAVSYAVLTASFTTTGTIGFTVTVTVDVALFPVVSATW